MSEPDPTTDWDEVMRLGLGVLRLSPDVFWAMTPHEFQCALEGAGILRRVFAAPGRTALEALMRQFPDTEKGMPDDK